MWYYIGMHADDVKVGAGLLSQMLELGNNNIILCITRLLGLDGASILCQREMANKYYCPVSQPIKRQKENLIRYFVRSVAPSLPYLTVYMVLFLSNAYSSSPARMHPINHIPPF